MKYVYIFILLMFNSCINNYYVNSKYIVEKYIKKNTKKSQNVETFYIGEPIKFEYDRIGFLVIEKGGEVPESHLLDHAKYTAWKNGADAIIALEKDIISNTHSTNSNYRTSGGQIVNNTDVHTTHSPFLKGIAVKKKVEFIDSIKIDTSFLQIVKNDKLKQKKADDDALLSGSIGTFIFLLLLLALLIAYVHKNR